MINNSIGIAGRFYFLSKRKYKGTHQVTTSSNYLCSIDRENKEKL